MFANYIFDELKSMIQSRCNKLSRGQSSRLNNNRNEQTIFGPFSVRYKIPSFHFSLSRKEYLRINNRLIKENYLCAAKWDELNFVERKKG